MAAPAAVIAKSHSRKKRFLVVGIAALAVLGAAMGVSFLDNSGATSLTISAAPSTLVYPIGSGAGQALPANTAAPLTTTAFSGKATLAGCTGIATVNYSGAGSATNGYTCSAGPSGSSVTGVTPSWSPVAGSAGAVTTAGDIAIVDATSATNYVTVSTYITNLASLLIDYSSFALPINVYQTNCTATSCSDWTPAAAVSQTTFGSYLTDTQGQLTFTLPAAAGRYYDIVMEGTNHYTASGTTTPAHAPVSQIATSAAAAIGGALAVTQTSGVNGSLSPTFFFTASTS